MSNLKNTRPLKFVILVLSITLAAVSGLMERAVDAYASGPPGSRTGAPGELTCNAAGCHNSSATTTNSSAITINGLPTNYTGGQAYTLTVIGNDTVNSNRNLYGFQVTALTDSGAQAGTFTITSNRTQLVQGTVNGNTRTYVEHTLTGTELVNGHGEWQFTWTAPATSAGKVTFYVAVNAANGTGTQAGDFIHTRSFSVDPQTVLAATTVSAANFAATPGVTAEGIVAAFGTKLATGTFTADDTDPGTPGIQLPTTLGGTTIKVRDSGNAERDAPLFFVSAGQANYQIPAGTASGTATTTITAGDGTISTGTVTIVSAAPALFSAASTGSGPAAALILRRNASGDTVEPVAQFNGTTNQWETVPVSLGPDTDELFLILFGTGFRNRDTGAALASTIGGLSSEVLFAGAQGGFVGLDQVNLRVLRTVTKDIDLDVIVSVGGVASNAVKVQFKN